MKIENNITWDENSLIFIFTLVEILIRSFEIEFKIT